MTIERFRGNGRTRALGRHAWIALLAILLLLLVAPAIARAQSDTLTLAWTAPGDDGSQGRASSYEVRMSTSPISPLRSVIQQPNQPHPRNVKKVPYV